MMSAQEFMAILDGRCRWRFSRSCRPASFECCDLTAISLSPPDPFLFLEPQQQQQPAQHGQARCQYLTSSLVQLSSLGLTVLALCSPSDCRSIARPFRPVVPLSLPEPLHGHLAQSLGDQLSQITMYDVKSYYNQAKNLVLNVPEMEAKVLEATNDDAWCVPFQLIQACPRPCALCDVFGC